MKVRLSLQHASGSLRHVEVEADATATVGDVANALAVGAAVSDPPELVTLVVIHPATGRRTVLEPKATLVDSEFESGVVVQVVPFDAAAARRRSGAAMVRVVSGPDQGVEVTLPLGRSTVGRSASCDVRLQDASVSKEHLEIVIGSRIEVVDTNSANGIRIGGVQVTRSVLDSGQVVTLGKTALTVTPLRTLTDAATADVAFTRSPRVLVRPVARALNVPEAPGEQSKQSFPLLAMLAPLLLGVVLYVFTRSLLSVLFVGLSPILMLGTWLTHVFERRRQLRTAIANFDAELAEVRRTHAELQAVDREQLLAMYPSVGECVEAIMGRKPMLWMRRPEAPEFLRLRLGLGVIASPTTLQLRGENGLRPQLVQARRAVQLSLTLDQAPVVADLPEVGCIGVTGSVDVSSGVVRSLVVQAAALHSPAELVITCLTSLSGRERWNWLEWLPHCSSPHSPVPAPHLSADDATGRLQLDALEGLVESRLAAANQRDLAVRGPLTEGPRERPRPAIPSVLAIIDDTPVDRARLTRLAERGPDAGVFLLWTSGVLADLPAACRTFLDLADPATPEVGQVRRENTVTPVQVESIDLATSVAVSRLISPVFDAGSPVDDDSDLPQDVSVISLLGRGAGDDPDALVQRWRQNRSLVTRDGSPPVAMDQQGGLRAVVGHAGTEHFALDLRVHGPHALVGGTTGAGKSEFLQAWVLGLAHAYSPDRVTFLFIDYKGGSAFAHCAELPHAVGLFSDLSPYLVRRALRSLGAEIHFREHLLNRKGKKDLIDLELTGDPECPPSLIIVVDEFAALKREIPEFLDGMIDIAQRGRSLGLHLVLATQRPAGVIDDNLRANTNLRIALRLADDADSVDVVGDKVAARFSPSRPGRAVAKTGPGRLIPFQAGYPGAKSPDVPPTPPIHIRDLDFGTGRAWPVSDRGGSGEEVESDAVRVVRTIRRAAAVAAVPVPRKPWLPTLADAYDLSRLGPRRDSEVILGLVDVPAEQEQRREYFRPDADGNIVFLGASGSGKSTALRTVALAMSITPRGGPVHVYGIDYGGGGLRMLEPLPNVGSIIAGEDTERVERLMRELAAVANRRKASFEAAHAGTLGEFRERTGQAHEPRILVLIDGFEAFRKDFEDRRGGLETYEAFQRLIVDGRSRGIHFAVTTDRPVGMPPAVLAAFPRRIVLRQADIEAYGFLGVPKDVLHAASPPGRAVEIGRGLELQLAILGTSVATAEQAREIEQLVPTVAALVREKPPVIERLKLQLPADEVPAVQHGHPVVGVSGRTLAPVTFEPSGIVLVTGPARSGRTNAVRWLAEAVAQACPRAERVRIGASAGRLGRDPIWSSTYGDVDELIEKLPELVEQARESAEAGIGLAIFVEGLADFENGPVESQIGDLIRACRRSGQLLIMESEAAALRESYGLKRPAVESARGVLVLQPGPDDGESFAKVSFPYATTQLPVGRGYWTSGGTAQLVQIPEVG